MKRLSVLFALIASPALAASGPFFSLRNTDFVVTLAFLVFIGILADQPELDRTSRHHRIYRPLP